MSEREWWNRFWYIEYRVFLKRGYTFGTQNILENAIYNAFCDKMLGSSIWNHLTVTCH